MSNIEQLVTEHPLQELETAIYNKRVDLLAEHVSYEVAPCKTKHNSMARGLTRSNKEFPGLGMTFNVSDAYFDAVGVKTDEEKAIEVATLKSLTYDLLRDDLGIPLPDGWSGGDNVKSHQFYIAYTTERDPQDVLPKLQKLLDSYFAAIREESKHGNPTVTVKLDPIPERELELG